MCKKKAYLIFAFEDEYIGDATEWHAQMDDFTLGDFIRNVPNVYDSRGFAILALVEFCLETHGKQSTLDKTHQLYNHETYIKLFVKTALHILHLLADKR